MNKGFFYLFFPEKLSASPVVQGEGIFFCKRVLITWRSNFPYFVQNICHSDEYLASYMRDGTANAC